MARRLGSGRMNLLYWLALLVAVALLVYLVVVLFYPERFS